MKTNFTVLIMTLIVSAFISCKKDNNTPTPQATDNTLLSSDTILYLIKKNSVINTELTYNTDKTVKTFTCYNDTGSFSYSATFEYNLVGKILFISYTYPNSAYNSYDSCCYNSSNLLVKIYNYSMSAQNYMQNLQYDNDERLIHLFILYGGTVFGLNFIYDNSSNVLKEYGSGDLVCDTTYYVYDNKKSIQIYGMPKTAALQLSANNIIQKMHHDTNGNPKPSDSYNSVFEYNTKGLPTKEIRTYLNSNVDVYEYFYH